MPTENSRLPLDRQKFARQMNRAAFASLLWSVISFRRKSGPLTIQAIADGLGTHKSVVSRWFSNDLPNWELDTVSDLAEFLNVEIDVIARDRASDVIFTSAGVREPGTSATAPTLPDRRHSATNVTPIAARILSFSD